MADAAAPVKVKGTRPSGTQSQLDVSRKVRQMFTQIAPRYDLLNHLLSFQFDRLWRARTARLLKPILNRPGAMVLDLCCGTGDLAVAFARVGKARLLGADFAHPMLVRAQQKAAELAPTSSPDAEPAISFFEADALRLPFADASFELVATAFGFRNLADYESGLQEMHRILKPGGAVAILEFAEPQTGFLGDLYRWYFRKILPRIGGLISGNRAAYAYLPNSVSRFFRPSELCALMAEAGFQFVEHQTWTIGAVALHQGTKPPGGPA